MSFNDLSLAERQGVQRAFSQAMYYAQRGFFDACRIYAPNMLPEERSRLTGVVGQFLLAYIVSELGNVIVPPSDGLTRIDVPAGALEPLEPHERKPL